MRKKATITFHHIYSQQFYLQIEVAEQQDFPDDTVLGRLHHVARERNAAAVETEQRAS